MIGLDKSWNKKAAKLIIKGYFSTSYIKGIGDFRTRALEELELKLLAAKLVPETTNDDGDFGIIEGLEQAIKIIKELKSSKNEQRNTISN